MDDQWGRTRAWMARLCMAGSILFAALPASATPAPAIPFQDAKVNVVMFWGSWCGNCPQVMQALEELRQRFGDQAVNFYAVSLGNEPDADGYLSRQGIGMEGVRDGASLLETYDAPGVPWVVMVDDQGRVIETPSRGTQPQAVPAMVEMGLNLRGYRGRNPH